MTLAIQIEEVRGGVMRATCPLLPGCVGYGATREEAYFELQAAMGDYFRDVRRLPPAYYGPAGGDA